MSLPRIEMTLDDEDEDTGVEKISLVDAPATRRQWLALREQQRQRVTFVNTGDEQVLYGPIIVPNEDIYRKDPVTGQEYNAFFSADTVRKMRDRFMMNNRNLAINLMHEQDTIGNGVVESWIIKDPAKDKAAALGMSDLPAGTWMAGVKITNHDFWNQQIKTGNYRGFSLEGDFATRPVSLSLHNPKSNMNPKTSPSFAERIAAATKPGGQAQRVKLASQERMLRPKGQYQYLRVRFDEQGQPLVLNPENPDETTLLPDGQYLDPQNAVIDIAQGVATGDPVPATLEADKSEPAPNVALATQEYVLADNAGTLLWDTEAQSGILRKADGTEVAVTAGQFKTNDGKMLTIQDGVIVESMAMSADAAGGNEEVKMRQQFMNNMSLQLSRVQIEQKKIRLEFAAELKQRDDQIVLLTEKNARLEAALQKAEGQSKTEPIDVRNRNVNVSFVDQITPQRASLSSHNNLVTQLKNENGARK